MPIAMILAEANPVQCSTGSEGLIGSMTMWLVSMMEHVGAVGVALAIMLESVFPPIPSEIVLPLAGFTAAHGDLSLFAAIIWATLGSLLGAWTLYGIARWVGLHRILNAADRMPGVSRKDVHQANAWFTKYGKWSVMIGRVIPVVRSLISIPAGFNRMNFATFSIFTFLGSLVWNTVLVGAGYLLGDEWCSILGVLNVFEDVIIVVFIGVLVFAAVRWVKRVSAEHKRKQSDDDDDMMHESTLMMDTTEERGAGELSAGSRTD
ncbi:DedA family protein [Bifidobacterium gallicum]|nr:DedA family protein [Bifidobacterium gallicum]KFI58943.1 membrane protein [Bifidobacterium gallicum DSM 20093 = LMG 11596]